ncbi:MAG TPA: hypothetical protein VJM10_05390 [Candidatus Methylomirabilis sp.]|nr:hypothetical protein [Candidatus Methylomirabilis sp.]
MTTIQGTWTDGSDDPTATTSQAGCMAYILNRPQCAQPYPIDHVILALLTEWRHTFYLPSDLDPDREFVGIGDYEHGSALQRSDLTVAWGDELQLILRSEPSFESVVDEAGDMLCYGADEVMFLRDREGRIRVVLGGGQSWCGDPSPETEAMLQEQARDSDQDGATDEDETCADEYDPFCGPVTDPFNRDTDGDGYWDGIEVYAETDATDPTSRPG